MAYYAAGNFPPVEFPIYNIVKFDDGSHTIEIALPGYSSGKVSIIKDGDVLTVSGELPWAYQDTAQYPVREFKLKKFSKQFKLDDDIVVDSAQMENGMLFIRCSQVVPKATGPVAIPIDEPKTKFRFLTEDEA